MLCDWAGGFGGARRVNRIKSNSGLGLTIVDQKQHNNGGKTLWEMFMRRLHGGAANGAGIAFANPLDLRVASAVNVPYANGADLANYDFTVQEIREYTRRIREQDFRFTDYVLRGVNKKSFD